MFAQQKAAYALQKHRQDFVMTNFFLFYFDLELVIQW